MNHCDDELRQAVALFRYRLLADIVHLPPGTPGVGGRLRDKAGHTYRRRLLGGLRCSVGSASAAPQGGATHRVAALEAVASGTHAAGSRAIAVLGAVLAVLTPFSVLAR